MLGLPPNTQSLTNETSHIGAIVIQITYGKEVWDDHGQELADLNIELMKLVAPAFHQFWLVNYIPICRTDILLPHADTEIAAVRFIPNWFPGARFKQLGQKTMRLQNLIREKPFQYAADHFATHGPIRSMASGMLELYGESANARDALAMLYSGMSLDSRHSRVRFINSGLAGVETVCATDLSLMSAKRDEDFIDHRQLFIRFDVIPRSVEKSTDRVGCRGRERASPYALRQAQPFVYRGSLERIAKMACFHPIRYNTFSITA